MSTSFKIKPQLAVDSYKLNHKAMYPKGTTKIYSNMTPRSGKIIENIIPYDVYDGKVVHFGLQGLIKHLVGLFEENFFNVPFSKAIQDYGTAIAPFTGEMKDTSGFEALHKLGYLPIEIRGLSEGTIVPYKVPTFTIKNTHPDFAWLTNYVETYFSNEYWKPATVATIARYYRKMFEKFAEETGVPPEFVDWQGHDFSCRGMSGMMDSAVSGSGHLTSFTGSDTVIAAEWLKYAYNGSETFIAASVPATEHSVSSANIMYNMEVHGVDRAEAEYMFFTDYITKIVPNGIASYVADTYDYWTVITDIAARAKEQILNRGADVFGNSKVVFRPDTGNPVEVVCGLDYLDFDDAQLYDGDIDEFLCEQHCDETVIKMGGKYYELKVESDSWGYFEWSTGKEIPEHIVKGSIECLWDTFGGTINEKGYKVLNPKVGLIYGDSITPERAWNILTGLKKKGFATGCIVFGIGSFTYQYITRDTLGWAIKATYLECNGKKINLYKDPKTGDGTKKSAKGLLQVYKNKVTGDYVLQDQVTEGQEQCGYLQLIWAEGDFGVETDLVTIRNNVRSSL
jgi:nicotinamide phosphoribosyltransferase